MFLVLTMAALLFGASACRDGSTGEKAKVVEASHGEIIRGHYLFGHEVRALRPCGEDEDVWVIDPTGVLVKQFRQLTGGLQGDARISVIATGRKGPAPAEGFGADYPGSVIIDEVIYAALEGYGCDFDLTGFVFRAYGNEPFWMVEVMPGAMRFSQPGSPEVIWPQVAGERQGNVMIFRGSGGEKSATLTIEPEPGYDNMSGSYFHHGARFDLDGDIFTGTALRGFPSMGGKSGE